MRAELTSKVAMHIEQYMRIQGCVCQLVGLQRPLAPIAAPFKPTHRFWHSAGIAIACHPKHQGNKATVLESLVEPKIEGLGVSVVQNYSQKNIVLRKKVGGIGGNVVSRVEFFAPKENYAFRPRSATTCANPQDGPPTASNASCRSTMH